MTVIGGHAGITILPLLSQVLNGIAAPVQNITVSLVSERWFPSGERTFATSVLVATCYGKCRSERVL